MFKITTFLRSKDDFKLVGIIDRKQENEIVKLIAVISLILWFLYTKLIFFLTRYYPFSHYWKKKMFHYDNRFLYKATIMIEEAINKLKKPFYIVGAGGDNYFYTFWGRFTNKKKYLPNYKTEAIIKKKFGLDDGDVFVRMGKHKFREILLDRNLLESVIERKV